MRDFGRLRRYLAIPSPSAARIARDVKTELQLHIELRTETLIASGIPAAEARARAIEEFGDLEDATAYCETMDHDAARRRHSRGWWSDIAQDVSHALRMLRRTPAFTAATVLTLALAIGATTAVYGVLDAYLLRPL